MNNKIELKTSQHNYEVIVQSGIRNNLTNILNKWNFGQKWIIITQKSISDLYSRELKILLNNSGYDIQEVLIPNSENAKSLSVVEDLFEKLIDLKCDRQSTIIALGGGVVGDVAGFAAATFMRGISYFQVPTTLLAMIDSAIGGKTGVNLKSGKNLVGAFYHPLAVISDPEFLNTLPARQITSGLGELLKYGLIKDKELFLNLNKNISHIIDAKNNSLLEAYIKKASLIKAEIVNLDEKEGDLRRILNYGHTIGHGLESTIGYDNILHGEAVAYGMIAASYISSQRGLISIDDFNFIVQTLNSLPLPNISILNRDNVLKAIYTDKKMSLGKLNFVLLQNIGQTTIVNDVQENEIIEALDYIGSF